MPGWETLMAAGVGGLAIGAGLAAMWSRQRQARDARERLELEARMRRVVIPVLERRADVLGIPVAQRGDDNEGTLGLVLELGRVIKNQEESAELPFGDTVEVERNKLDTTKKTKKPRETA